LLIHSPITVSGPGTSNVRLHFNKWPSVRTPKGNFYFYRPTFKKHSPTYRSLKATVLNTPIVTACSSVSTVTRLRAQWPELASQQEQGIFLFVAASRLIVGPTQRPIQYLPAALSPGIKRPGREADYSTPSSGDVRKREGVPAAFLHLRGVLLS